MRAVVLEQQGQPLKPVDLPDPVPGPGQLLLEVQACGVCRTDLHLRDAEIQAGKLPVVLGHQIVGTTEEDFIWENFLACSARFASPSTSWPSMRFCQRKVPGE